VTAPWRSLVLLLVVSVPALSSSCGDGRDSEDAEAGVDYQLAALCERPGNDDVRDLFCVLDAPAITSIAELSDALDLDLANMLGHSSALSGRLVSQINPRVIRFRGDLEADFNALAFTRGQQRVELVAQDRDSKRLNFYLLDFVQACNQADHGCKPGDLFTPAIESDWLELQLRDDEDLKNTPTDCRRCHGGGEGQQATPMLLMREFEAPWMHWFEHFSVGRYEYLAAKEYPDHPGTVMTEPYAGLGLLEVLDTAVDIQKRIRANEENLGHPPQPLVFPSPDIGFETMQYYGPVGVYPGAGIDDPTVSRSPTWQLLYNAFLDGKALAPPYHHDRISVPEKLATMTKAYKRFLSGELAAEDLPDISDLLPDDPHLLAEIGFNVEPDAEGPDLLIQACRSCHNDTLDPTISRARFDVQLDRMSRTELELAAHRVSLSEDDPLRMPPMDARALDSESRTRLRRYLEEAAADATR